MTALLELGAGIGWVDAEAAQAARTAAVSGTGRLGELVTWLAGVQGQYPLRGLQRVRCIALGTPAPALHELGAQHDVGIRELALPDDSRDALPIGLAAVEDEIESGADLLVLAAAEESSAPTTLIGLLTDTEPVALLPRGVAAIDSADWIERAARLRDERGRLARLRTRTDDLLAELGSPVVSAATGVALHAAARRTPVILDGTAALAAAMVGLDIQSRASQWWQVADTSPERAHRRAAARLELAPVLDLGTDLGNGIAGMLAVAVLRAAVLTTGHRDG